MDRLLLLVLLAVFAVSSYGYSIPQKQTHNEPDMPIEFHDLPNAIDETYPAEYIEEQWALLTPAQREEFTIDMTLLERDGFKGSEYCNSAYFDLNLGRARAVDDYHEYTVVEPKNITIQRCMSYGHSCKKNAPIRERMEKGCCLMKEKIMEMTVLSIPLIENVKCTTDCGKFVKKNMTLGTSCDCFVFIKDAHDDIGSTQCAIY